MNDTPALAGFHAPLPATLAVPSALAVDVSAGFLDRVADAADLEFRRGGQEHRARYPGNPLYARAAWHSTLPRNAYPATDKRKRERHAAAAERIMSRMIAYAEARSGLSHALLAAMPWTQWQGTQQAAARLRQDLITARSYVTLVIRNGQVPEGTETEMLVAEMVTRSQQAMAERLPAEIPAPRPAADAELAEAGPAGAVGSAVISDEQAAAEELDRARESVLGSLRRKLEATPDATDKELRQCGQNKYRKLVDMSALIAGARGESGA